MSALLEIQALTKYFRSHWTFRPLKAVEDVSLHVSPGQTFGFIGHNGAGKTTTIKSVVGLINVTRGTILFRGKRIGSNERKFLGYLPEQPYFYDHLTVWETLDFFSSLHGIPSRERKQRIDTIIEMLGLGEKKKTSVRALSKGLQQRLGLAQAIINRPELLLLDEPFSGLDPLGRAEIRDLILRLRSEGTAVFLSSHILSDVEDICDTVGIMARGRLRSVFQLSDAPKLFGETFELSILTGPERSEHEEQAVNSVRSCADDVETMQTSRGEELVLKFKDYDHAREMLATAASAGLRLGEFRRVNLRLEDIFKRITESAVEDGENRETRSS